MSTAPSIAKRARADTNGRSLDRPGISGNGPELAESSSSGSGSRSASDIKNLIDELPSEKVNEILAQAAARHPDVLQKIQDVVTAARERERSRIINFDHYSKSVWKSLNVTYRSMSGSAQYDISFEVVEEIDGTIKHIVSQCGRHANPQTRWNGLSVLRKIGKSIVLSGGDTLGHEVQKQY
ncbi:hypothetical protein VTN96DRAFT_7918 [Rasamsonia emersonii]|uniref:Uncharacterized protein n=1 Tax=Rasamsonia emersonii (strain ATCC 16479 / CBS 393.64 / IMI 116815) TaxID=1408163 RepID=A0A0F4YSE6_RASE3|nr:hypothetical protein T310_5422 [Rasamsonia emersonii CBS 393.64]KKA20558.1 hypothetical protein T310_5422 [Rasamsonia emersonii CBS 393.64]